MTDFTHFNLDEVKDQAPGFGLDDFQEARFANSDSDAKDTGFSMFRIKPNQRPPFAHRHEDAEEVYLILGGSGRAKLDDEIIELKRLDAIRVAPGVTRAWEAGPDGLELLAFGPRHEGDGEIIQGWWTD
ncbi:cupin domain-containing protein [Thermoleophilia bacterium SCSIO 60948]|nr:cupin domain-containing protein [Thermoleophilia bacterium SCSIO 60948]